MQMQEPYKNTKLSVEERAADLVGRMTLEEKISQMLHNAPAIERLGIAEYNWWNECLHGGVF
jgi:beta-glucosidase